MKRSKSFIRKRSFDEWYKKSATRYKDLRKTSARAIFYKGWAESWKECWQYQSDLVSRQRTEIYQLTAKNKELEEYMKLMATPFEARKNRVKKIYQHAVKHWATPDEWFNMMGKILSEE